MKTGKQIHLIADIRSNIGYHTIISSIGILYPKRQEVYELSLFIYIKTLDWKTIECCKEQGILAKNNYISSNVW